MSEEKITAETLAKVAAKLGIKPSSAQRTKPKFPFDIEVEEIIIGKDTHCRLHLVHYGYGGRPSRSMSSNHTPGPDLDALLVEAERLGFRLIRTKARS